MNNNDNGINLLWMHYGFAEMSFGIQFLFFFVRKFLLRRFSGIHKRCTFSLSTIFFLSLSRMACFSIWILWNTKSIQRNVQIGTTKAQDNKKYT